MRLRPPWRIGTRTDSQTGPQAVTMAATVTASRILSALVIA